MPSISIHQANKTQIDDLISVFKGIVMPLSYYNDTAKEHELIKYNFKELESKIESDPDSVIIAEEEDEIVGFCFSRLDDMTIWLEWFGVKESARRNGIAKKLVHYLESTVQNRNAHKIWCDCRTENMKSINLLSSCGYTPICTLRNHWYRQDFILWQKEVN